MTALTKFSCLLALLACAGCQQEPATVADPATDTKGTALTIGKVTNAPLAAYQSDLLQLAFTAASKFPSDPHAKNRGRAQDVVVAACFGLQQPLQALAFAPHVEGWHRAIAYADFAWCCAKVGDAEMTKRYVKLAEAVLEEQRNDNTAQEWRADKVRVKIARAFDTLGLADKVAEYLGQVAEASRGAVDARWSSTMADRIGAMSLAAAEGELQRITDGFLNQAMGEQYTSLMLLGGMHGKFFTNEPLRSAIEERIYARFDKLPTKLRLDAMAPLVEHYVANGDADAARDGVVRMTDLMAKFQFRTEDRIPQLARIGELRLLCGDAERARAELLTAINDYQEHRDEVVNIYRCETLRPLALAWHKVGDAEQANDLLALALEESLENPNSRPRCDDLVETCVAMAEHELQPSPALLARMREICEGLSNPR